MTVTQNNTFVDSRVFIVPDGVLHGLNFETLLVPTANGPKYWIEDATVTTAVSRLRALLGLFMPFPLLAYSQCLAPAATGE